MLRNIAGGSGDVLDQMTDLSAGIMLGDTLDDDRFEGRTFNYQLTNPPYGKEWKKEKDAVLEEMGRGFDGRFGAGKPDIDDGSMLFMQNVAAKMAPPKEGGGKAAIVLSGSPLFNGDAGSGPSGIRRWLFSEDLVDCIVKLPTEIFYRTGIATYIWVLNNHKPENRKGYVQLIDASEEKTALRKSQGNKRYEIGEDQAAWIVRTYVDGHDHGRSVIVPVENFMYRKVTTQRPLRVVIEPSVDGLDALFTLSKPMEKLSDASRAAIRSWVEKNEGASLTYSEVLAATEKLHKARKAQATEGRPRRRPRQGLRTSRPVRDSRNRCEGQSGVRPRAQGHGERSNRHGNQRLHGDRGAALRSRRRGGRVRKGRAEVRRQERAHGQPARRRRGWRRRNDHLVQQVFLQVREASRPASHR